MAVIKRWSLLAVALALGVCVASCADFDTVQGKATRSKLENLSYSLQIYVADVGEPPASLSRLAYPPAGFKPYLEVRDLQDGWGRPISYRLEAETFRLGSAGADQRPDTFDDIIWRARLDGAVPVEPPREPDDPWMWPSEIDKFDLSG